MTGNKEYDVAEMLAKMCIRHECKENTCCPVGSAMDCPFHPELLCDDITSEDWILWMYAEEKKCSKNLSRARCAEVRHTLLALLDVFEPHVKTRTAR